MTIIRSNTFSRSNIQIHSERGHKFISHITVKDLLVLDIYQ